MHESLKVLHKNIDTLERKAKEKRAKNVEDFLENPATKLILNMEKMVLLCQRIYRYLNEALNYRALGELRNLCLQCIDEEESFDECAATVRLFRINKNKAVQEISNEEEKTLVYELIDTLKNILFEAVGHTEDVERTVNRIFTPKHHVKGFLHVPMIKLKLKAFCEYIYECETFRQKKFSELADAGDHCNKKRVSISEENNTMQTIPSREDLEEVDTLPIHLPK